MLKWQQELYDRVAAMDNSTLLDATLGFNYVPFTSQQERAEFEYRLLELELRGRLQEWLHGRTIASFVQEVNALAEQTIQETHVVEGAHYNAMQKVLHGYTK